MNHFQAKLLWSLGLHLFQLSPTRDVFLFIIWYRLFIGCNPVLSQLREGQPNIAQETVLDFMRGRNAIGWLVWRATKEIQLPYVLQISRAQFLCNFLTSPDVHFIEFLWRPLSLFFGQRRYIAM